MQQVSDLCGALTYRERGAGRVGIPLVYIWRLYSQSKGGGRKPGNGPGHLSGVYISKVNVGEGVGDSRGHGPGHLPVVYFFHSGSMVMR